MKGLSEGWRYGSIENLRVFQSNGDWASEAYADAYKTCVDELEGARAARWPWRCVKDEFPERDRLCLVISEGTLMVCGRGGKGEEWIFVGVEWNYRTPILLSDLWLYADEVPPPQSKNNEGE